MKVVILAGGIGSRISEESHLRPKPMIEIGDKPILWHVMKSYSYYGFNEFVICCGYKAHVIKEYFYNYYLHRSDMTFDFSQDNKITIHNNVSEPWKVTVVDTGLLTMTGGRVKRIQEYIGEERFMLTYGDGVSNVDFKELLEFHKQQGKMVTMTAIQPDGRFGVLDIDNNNTIKFFREKSKSDSGWINGGFMVVEPEIFEYIEGDKIMFEREPLEAIAEKGELSAYKHTGFWKCMDTLRDKEYLEKKISENNTPWIRW